jgi:DNA transformation protein and related proteins
MDDESLRELFAEIGPIQIRKLFGGQGVYAGGMIVAVVVHGDLMLKIDAETEQLFAAAGSRQWTYARPGKAPVRMPYSTMPDDAFDDPDSAAHWTRLAVDAARRQGATRKTVPKPGGTKPNRRTR